MLKKISIQFFLFFFIFQVVLSKVDAENLNTVYPYTLFLKQEGVVPGYFPMGMRPGMVQETVNCGFNFVQIDEIAKDYAKGLPYPLPPAPSPYGMRIFSQGKGATVLENAKLPLQTEKWGTLQPALQPDGTPQKKGLRWVRIFQKETQNFLFDYAKAHVSAVSPSTANAFTLFWGLDNEWEGAMDYSPDARQAFSLWLEKAYGRDGLPILNTAWGTNFKSYVEASESPMPEANDYKKNPGRFLDWWNFQSESFVRLQAERAKLMHDTDPLHRGVIIKSTQQTIEMPRANRERTFDHATLAEELRPLSNGYYGINIYGSGDRQSYELNYAYNCIRPLDGKAGYGVIILENNTHKGPGHQWGATNWRLLANGLKGVVNWCTGWAGAVKDYDKFGHIDSATGKPKEKMLYAARWAQSVHRMEKFWSTSTPMKEVPKIAMLMPRRDVLLSDTSSRRESKWGYPRDHRWLIYRWLREQGYWVDIIPYTKIKDESLKQYDALFLIGAEHLTKEECETVSSYIKNGGKLLADGRAGEFNEHHIQKGGLSSVIGCKFASWDEAAEVTFDFKGSHFKARTATSWQPISAKVLFIDSNRKPLIYSNDWGKGKVLLLTTELGSIELDRKQAAMDAQLLTGPTADSEEYAPSPDESFMGQWLAGWMKQIGLAPSYQMSEGGELPVPLRVEQPMNDSDGNAAIVVANRALGAVHEKVPPARIRISLKNDTWKTALWAPAENMSMTEIPFRKIKESLYEIELPEIVSAGVVWLFKNAPPLLDIESIAGVEKGGDGYNPKMKAGQPFQVTVRLKNLSSDKWKQGNLRFLALPGWSVTPSSVPTPVLPLGKSESFTFTVVPESDPTKASPDWLYPLVARWSQGGADEAVCSMNVELIFPDEKVPKLLTDNASYPATYPYRVKTGSTYSYLAPTDFKLIKDEAKDGTKSCLLNGFGNDHVQRESRKTDKNVFATYKADDIVLLFDLKKSYEVMRIIVNGVPQLPIPNKVDIALSSDGEKFIDLKSFSMDENETSSPWFSEPARYVRLTLHFPQGGGAVDEIEVWGR